VSDAYNDDNTPPDGPFAIRQVLKKLESFDRRFDKMEEHCKSAADSSLEALETVRHLRIEVHELKREHDTRLTRLEVERMWIPRLVATAALIIATTALIFSLIALERHQ
jgi:hypothetical protein